MSDDSQPTTEPLAVDPAYRLRDNQFWYGDCAFAGQIRERTSISLRIDGLGIRTLTHAARGKDGRPTYSFTVPTPEDREWWKRHNQQRIRVELLSIGEQSARLERAPAEEKGSLFVSPAVNDPVQVRKPSPALKRAQIDRATLCIGLDIAWFGGSKSNPDSKYDCIGSVVVGGESGEDEFNLTRVSLGKDRDPDAAKTLEAIQELLDPYLPNGTPIVFSLDAPIQARDRQPPLPVRQPSLKKGEKGKIERRASDNRLEAGRKRIDKAHGGSSGWNPNIQAGAPLAPRVEKLLAGLKKLGFELWSPESHAASRLVIECFPAEAIWAAKCMDGFRTDITAPCAKAYKKQKGVRLASEQVHKLTEDVLHAFSIPSGDETMWPALVTNAINWMLEDRTRRTPDDLYRGGKLLDDVVDTMICLATALSYSRRNAHVWFASDNIDDGHIIGPGYQDDGRWVAAWPLEEDEGGG
ncbi:MAG: hypothetical protein WD049_07945 [Candidatus Paceibacterota bacterium]